MDLNNLIHVSDNSIPPELCSDIVDIFDDSHSNNLFLENSLSENYIFEVMNNRYGKISQVLKYELSRQLKVYHNKIHSNLNEDERILKTFDVNNIRYTIRKNKSDKPSDEIYLEYCKRYQWHNKQVSQLTFIWFLNDFEGDITFWNIYKIRPTCGMLLIYPTSWCFPYSECIKSNAENYSIIGQLF